MTTELQINAKTDVMQRLADQYGTTRTNLYSIVKASCKMEKATNEQFQAFLMIAEKYNLNPLAKQMWAYPDKNGGITYMVSLDGWVNIVNNHPQFDGYETSVELGEDGKPISATCTIWRKDKTRPITKKVYLNEWKVGTSPVWQKMPIHFLEMRAYIQAARMAFNISGISDADAPMWHIEGGEPDNKYPNAIDITQIQSDEEINETPDYANMISKATTIEAINILDGYQFTDQDLKIALYKKAKELGFVFDTNEKCYVEKN